MKRQARYGHTAVVWNDRVVSFGGVGPLGCLNSVCILTSFTTTALIDLENEGPKAGIPKARAFHSAVVVDSYMVVYGGYDETDALLHDVCTLHLPSMVWTKPSYTGLEAPPPRACHGAALTGRGTMLVFGGVVGGAGKPSDDVWALSFAPPEKSIPQEIFQDMCASLLERTQRHVDALSAEFDHTVGRLQAEAAQDREGLEDATLEAQGLAEQVRNLREQRDSYEQRVTSQQALLGEMEARSEGARRQAQESVARTEMELQRLQRKVKKLVGPQGGGTQGMLPRQDVELLLEDESQVQDSATALCGHRLSPALYRHAYVGAEALVVRGDPKWEEALQLELRIAQTLRHPHLVETFGGVVFPDGICVVQEPLFDTWVDFLHEPTTEEEKLTVALELATAVEYLHSRGVAHTNISLGSCFVKSLDPLSVKLGRVVSSRAACRHFRVLVVPSPYHPAVPDLHAARRAGAAEAPFDPRQEDIAALGSLLCALFIAQEPDPASRVAQIDRVENRQVQMLVMACLDKDPRHRPSARMLVQALVDVRDGVMPQLQRLDDDPSVIAPLVDIYLDEA